MPDSLAKAARATRCGLDLLSPAQLVKDPMRYFLKLLALPALLLASPALADNGIHVSDPYARIISGSGVVYFMIDNHVASDDSLISVRTDIAMAMLMSSAEDANGVMQMRPVMAGFPVKAGGRLVLQSAADHVMLSGLTAAPEQGATFSLILTFQKVGEVTLTVPVDNTRRTPPGMGPTDYDARSEAVD